MKKYIILIISLLSVAFYSYTKPTDEKKISKETISKLLVSNPDSLLSILDKESSENFDLPQYKIDLYRGLAYNEKQMPTLVEQYASKVLASDSMNTNQPIKLQALVMLSGAQKGNRKFEESIKTANEAISLAREIGNKPAELNLLSNIAQVFLSMGDNEKGHKYLKEIIDHAQNATTARELANISYAYGMLIVQLQSENKYEEALRECYNRLNLIDKIDELGGAPNGYTDQQRAYTYARMASSAQILGKTDVAKNAFKLFNGTQYGNSVIGKKYITDYLVESKQWNAVLQNTKPLFASFENNDTINETFLSLLKVNASAQSGIGNHKAAYMLSQRANTIADSIYLREKNSKAQELATVFDLNEKELELQKSKAKTKQKEIVILFTCGVASLILIILIIIIIQYRITLKRNRIAAKQIDELMAQKKIIYSVRDTEIATLSESNSDFHKLEKTIIENKLFIQQDINRDTLANMCGISRGKLVQLINDNTGMTPNDYINKLRVEYSVKLIQEHPNWTIDAIAEEAGYGRRATFYIHFNKIYGITPAQYRKDRMSNNQ